MNKTIALQNLKDLKEIFESMNITYWITDGTLLGFHREGDFIDHDLDTDFGIMASDYSPLLIRRIALAGFSLTRVYGTFENGLEIAFHRKGVKTDLFFYYAEGDDLVHSAWDQQPNNGAWQQIKYRYPKKFILPVEKRSYKGDRWNVPAMPVNFLLHKYGDFTQVVKEWDWRYGPLNSEKTEFSYQDNLAVSNRIYSAFNWDMLSSVTLLIKSFLRKDCLENLLKSIRLRYQDIKILVVDDSEQDPDANYWLQLEKKYKIAFHLMPFDSGLAACRNQGVRMIKTPFFILLDDDFEFTDSTDLLTFIAVYVQCGLDILGGVIEENGQIIEYYGNLDIDVVNRKLTYKRLEEPSVLIDGVKNSFVIYPQECDLILNFFIARTSDIRRYPWDNKQKLAEHTAFFYDIKGKLKVGYTDQAKVLHKPKRLPEYMEFRSRGPMFFRHWMERKGLRSVVSFDGKEVII